MFTRAFLALAIAASSANAFMTPALPLGTASRRAATMGKRDLLRMQAEEEGPKPVATGGTDYSKVPKKEVTPLFLIPSSSIIGDGRMSGDKGFDPLGLATSMEKLNQYREAELKHCRLAMLAALGWPLAEELNEPLSNALGMPTLLVKGATVAGGDLDVASRVPSVLNGGLDQVSPLYWLFVIGLSAAIEAYGLRVQKSANYLPGDLGFDPLNLYQKLDPAGKKDMQLKELNNGRLAMIAVTGYAFNEAATKISVVKEIGL